ncbi:uncharacterized protein [Lolium perenne]|uniref:uncharacterized protein n=1 Tax=Lolium perenne TaxID=4522 RepID=UPI0021EA2708|nr:uncharacterized protein LOC127301628 [Lolium perenne]
MATPRFLAILLVAALLALSFSQGPVLVAEGRKVQVLRAAGHSGRRPLHGGVRLQEQQQGMVSTVMDYDEPKANTNPHGSVPATPDYPTGPPGH